MSVHQDKILNRTNRVLVVDLEEAVYVFLGGMVNRNAWDSKDVNSGLMGNLGSKIDEAIRLTGGTPYTGEIERPRVLTATEHMETPKRSPSSPPQKKKTHLAQKENHK